MNAVEREQLAKAEIERQQAMLDYQLDLMKREVARQGELDQVKIQSQVDLTKLQQSSEDGLEHGAQQRGELISTLVRGRPAGRKCDLCRTRSISCAPKGRPGVENELADRGS